MDFIVLCPHCNAYIGIDRHSFQDVDYYHHYGKFTAHGTLTCPECEKEATMEIFLEPVNYNISRLEW